MKNYLLLLITGSLLLSVAFNVLLGVDLILNSDNQQNLLQIVDRLSNIGDTLEEVLNSKISPDEKVMNEIGVKFKIVVQLANANPNISIRIDELEHVGNTFSGLATDTINLLIDKQITEKEMQYFKEVSSLIRLLTKDVLVNSKYDVNVFNCNIDDVYSVLRDSEKTPYRLIQNE